MYGQQRLLDLGVRLLLAERQEQHRELLLFLGSELFLSFVCLRLVEGCEEVGDQLGLVLGELGLARVLGLVAQRAKKQLQLLLVVARNLIQDVRNLLFARRVTVCRRARR